MDHEKKLAFIAKMTKMGLDHIQHLDGGGIVNTTNNNTGDGLIGPINSGLGLEDNFVGQASTITPGTTPGQLAGAYTGATGALNQQQQLVSDTNPGISGGLSAQAQLDQQLADRSNGVGADPAQAALSRSTGKNVANTAAAIAGSRGSNTNAGLLARQAGQAGAGIEQDAVGQSATLEAQQEIAAQQQRQALASQRVGQGATAIQNLNQQQQNEQGILQGANTAENNAGVSLQSNINNVNSQTAAANQNSATNTLGGILSGASSLFSSGSSLLSGLAKGGLVKMDKGGKVLSEADRKKIPPEHFALPGGRYPIHDVSHARNALARVSQNGTPSEKARVKAAVAKKYPDMGKKKMADGGEVNGDDTPTFQSTPSESSTGPSVPATGTLPANTTDLSKAMSSSGGSSGGGGGGSGISSLLPLLAALARGGEVRAGYLPAKRMATGGYLAPTPLVVDSPGATQSFVGQWVNSPQSNSSMPNVSATAALPENTDDLSEDVENGTKKKPATKTAGGVGQGAASGANAGTVSGNQSERPDYASGGNVLAAKGGDVKARNPAQKANIKGDNLKNDKIPTMLSEGEVVMDRELLSDPGTIGKMARQVAKYIEKRNGKK